MKPKLIIFDFAGTLVKMRPPELLINREQLINLAFLYKLGIVTGGSRVEVLNVLKKLSVIIFFDETRIITKNDTKFWKPDPRLLKLALKNNLGESLYIGDTRKDGKMAKAAGVKFILADRNLARELDKLLLSGGKI